jgi:hypothetical protein
MGIGGLLAITRCRQSYRIGMTQPGEDLHELDGPEVASGRDVEVPEADAYEQSQVVELDDDYR